MRQIQEQPLGYSMQSLDELRNNQDAWSQTTISSSDDSAIIRVNKTLRLGHVFSILPSLVLDRVGISIEVASLLAVKHFNERSGAVLPQLPALLHDCDVFLTWTPLDSEAQPMPAVKKLLEQIPHNPTQASIQKPYPMALLGAGYSIPSESLAIIGGVRGMPQCSCCATSRDLDTNGHEYFSRTTPTGQGEARAAAAYFHELGVQEAAVLHVGETYALFFAEDFSKAMKDLGHKHTLNVEYALEDEASALMAMKKIRESGLRYIYGILYVQDTLMLANVASMVGVMGPDYVWVWAQGANSITSLNQQHVPEETLRALHGVGATILETPVNTRYNAALQAFQQDEELMQYYISKQENPDFFDTFDMSTVPPLHYSLNNYDAAITVGLAACRAKNDLFTASELYENMISVDFDGASGHVSFNKTTGTRSIQGIRYMVQNVLAGRATDGTANFTAVVSARIDFESPNVVEFVTPFVYNDNTTTRPISLPPLEPETNLIGTGARITGLVLAALIMLMSVGWALWTYRHRKQRQVRAAQPFFLFMICIGTFIMASSVIPTSFQEPMKEGVLDAGCMMFPWLFFIGFVTVFSALFTKVRRIYSLFQHSKAFRRVKIRPIDTLVPFAILLLVNIALLIAWTVVAPWEWERLPGAGVDRFGRPTETYGSCTSNNETAALTFGVLLLVVNFVPVILANYQTYQARSLPTQFNESKYIALSMAILLEAALLGLPIIIMARDEPTAHFIVQAVVIFIVCLAILLCMFVPKWLNKNKPEAEARYVTSTETSALPSNASTGRSSFSKAPLRPNPSSSSKFTAREYEQHSNAT